MKRTLFFTKISLILFFVFACDSTLNYEMPEIECNEPQIVPTTTLATLQSIYDFRGPVTIAREEIVTGFVVSDDRSGNIYKTIIVQDAPEDPESAISISVDATKLFSKFNVGRKVYIKLKGLSIGQSYGRIQVGKGSGTEITAIPSSEIDKHIIRSCETYEIVPKKISVSDIEPSMYNMLLQIEDVQFSPLDVGLSFANPDSNSPVLRTIHEFDEHCELKGAISIKTSGFADFKNQLLTEGKGKIIAICGNYYNDVELYLRNSTDIILDEERCTYSEALKVTKTIPQIKELYKDTRIEFGVNEDFIIEGFVVSSDAQGNFQNRLIIQEAIENPEGGLQILLEESEIFRRYGVGDKLKIKLNRLYMDKIDGVISIGIPNRESLGALSIELEKLQIFNTQENFNIIPKEITLATLYDEKNVGIMVQLNNVELAANELGKAFAYFSGDENGQRTLISCTEISRATVFTNGKATFANNKFPEGKGSIKGVLSNYLEVLKMEDVQFNEPYEVCAIEERNILITEVADPKNSVSARFVELYNANEKDFNLTGWKLKKYINGSNSASTGVVALDNVILPAKGYLIVANSGYQELFADTPDILTTYISGNGDDVYELVDNTGDTIDVFGEIGKDGNGTNWEYLDGRAVRNKEIVKPSPIFFKEEWVVYSVSSNPLIDYPAKAQNAPQDYNPREH